MVSFRLPNEHNMRLSFLLFLGEVDEEEDEEDKEEDEEVVEGVGLDGSLRSGWFSSASSMWTTLEPVEERRAEMLSSDGSIWKTDMALRRQLSHCCLWKTSFTCNVCDWPCDGS